MPIRKGHKNQEGSTEDTSIFVIITVSVIVFMSIGSWYLSDMSYKVTLSTNELVLKMNNTKNIIQALNKEISSIEKVGKLRKRIQMEPQVIGEELTTNPIRSKNSQSNLKTNYNIDKSNIGEVTTWYDNLLAKIHCLREMKSSIFLYHVRKAAGTTLRNILGASSRAWNVPLFESEGVSLDESFLSLNGIISVISLRHPIDRIKSMYWYEHVGWWDGIVHETNKCKTFNQWVEAWRDGSQWKQAFTARNPGNVYVEVENYYTKLLVGWRGGAVDRSHLELAKQRLRDFDLVLLSDRLSSNGHQRLLDFALQIETARTGGHELRGDAGAKARLFAVLAADEESVLTTLRKVNNLDLELWEYAQQLVGARGKAIEALDANAITHPPRPPRHVCPSPDPPPPKLSTLLGIHRPPGHKGPIDGFYK